MEADKKILINKTKLHEIIENTIQSYLNTNDGALLLEMAMERREYKNRMTYLLPQIIENWCLIYYSKITNTHAELAKHWKSELRTLMTQIMLNKLKCKDTNEKKMGIILEVFNEQEYNNEDVIDMLISNKFENERIELGTEEYYETIKQFINYSDGLISVLSQYGNNKLLKSYLSTL